MAGLLKVIMEAVVEKTVENVLQASGSRIQRVSSAGQDLQKLDSTACRIQALLRDAEKSRFIDDQSALLWLHELRAVALDAEDLSNEFHTFQRQAKNDAGGSSRKRKRSSLGSWPWLSWLDYWRDGADLASKVEKIKKRYEAISDDYKSLRSREGETKWRVLTREPAMPSQHSSSSLQDPSQFHGRQAETNEIIRILGSSGGSNIVGVISILGAGGLGKTAIAKKIFRDERVAQRFHSKVWVDLSQGSNVMRATKEIIDSLTGNDCRLCRLDDMQRRLRQLVTGKRVLLVLDNMSSESSNFFDTLQLPLMGAEDGSKILITTQNEMVSRHMRAEHCLNLNGLPEDDCWLLFQDRAFVRGEARRVLEENPILEAIGKEIVKKCQGSPLTVRTIGSLLYSVTKEDEWKSVLSDMPDIEDVTQTILPTLKVSYDYLSLELKRCFEFCSIFPKDYEFDKGELVRLWMAVGFIETNNGRTPLENICGRYFNDLLGRSFFQPCDVNQSHNQKYRMPSMIHDLAQHVSQYECLRFEHDVVQHGELKWARYTLYMEPKKFEKIGDSESLRALILRYKNGLEEPAKQVLLQRLKELRFLRVLDLSNSQLEEWPDSINGLILLRYLSMSGAKIKKVPESVCDFHDLQTLELGKCNQLQEISESIGELEHLRYLGLSQTAITRLPNSIGKLKELRYLVLHHTPIQRFPQSVTSLYNLCPLDLTGCYNLLELPHRPTTSQRPTNMAGGVASTLTTGFDI